MLGAGVLYLTVGALVVVLLVLSVAFCALLSWQAKERRELYSRIQAGTLRDYSVLSGQEGSARRDAPVDLPRSMEELTALPDNLPEPIVVESMADFNSLMSC